MTIGGTIVGSTAMRLWAKKLAMLLLVEGPTLRLSFQQLPPAGFRILPACRPPRVSSSARRMPPSRLPHSRAPSFRCHHHRRLVQCARRLEQLRWRVGSLASLQSASALAASSALPRNRRAADALAGAAAAVWFRHGRRHRGPSMITTLPEGYTDVAAPIERVLPRAADEAARRRRRC